MSATTSAGAPGVLDVSGTKPVPFTRQVSVELRKSYDTRSGFWLIASMGILTVLILGIVVLVAATTDASFTYGTLVQFAGAGTALLLPVLGILLVTSEWSQRTTMTTFVLEPRRGHVLVAKAAVGLILTAAVAVFALVVGAAATVVVDAVSATGAEWDLGWRGFIAFVITQSLAMLTGFGFAVLLLSSPAAIVVFFAYSFVLPIAFAFLGGFVGWFGDLAPWIEFGTAQAALFGSDFGGTGEALELSAKELGRLVTSGAIWLGLPMAIGTLRVLRSEVK